MRDYKRGHTGEVTAVQISDDYATLYTGSTDRTVIFWSTEDASVQAVFKGFPGMFAPLPLPPCACTWRGPV